METSEESQTYSKLLTLIVLPPSDSGCNYVGKEGKEKKSGREGTGRPLFFPSLSSQRPEAYAVYADGPRPRPRKGTRFNECRDLEAIKLTVGLILIGCVFAILPTTARKRRNGEGNWQVEQFSILQREEKSNSEPLSTRSNSYVTEIIWAITTVLIILFRVSQIKQVYYCMLPVLSQSKSYTKSDIFITQDCREKKVKLMLALSANHKTYPCQFALPDSIPNLALTNGKDKIQIQRYIFL